VGVKPIKACCGARGPLCCGAPPQGLCKAPHDPGICWKQLMMCLEATWFVAAFLSTPMHDPGPEECQRPVRVCVNTGSQCATLPPQLLAVVGVEIRPPFSDPGCALRHRPAPVLPGHPGVAPRLPDEGLAMAKGGVVTSLCHPARFCARRAHSVNSVGRSNCFRWR